MIKAVICWAGVSGYMAACWRALAARQDIDLHIIALPSAVPFADDLTADLPCRPLAEHQQNDFNLIRAQVAKHDPRVIVINGWHRPPYVQLTRDPSLARARFIMAMDTPWQGTWRQRVAPLILRRLIRRLSAVVVAGDRAANYAQRLGIPTSQIHRGMYGFDDQPLTHLHAKREALPGGWPRRFLYVGRYVHTKGIDLLIDAYRQYRAAVSNPWSLTCCGAGDLAHLLRDESGVTDRRFIQPADLPGILTEHGAFVIASRFEPWGVVIAEAAAAGLPILCTDACGAALDIVQHDHNGRIIKSNDAAALAAALQWIHDRHADLPQIGARSRPIAAAFSADAWSQQWAQMFQNVIQDPPAP